MSEQQIENQVNMENQITSNIFYCKQCNFRSFNKSNFLKHQLTNKHKKRTNLTNLTNSPIKTYQCDKCGKSYKHLSSLSKHKQICDISQNKEKYIMKENVEQEMITLLRQMIQLQQTMKQLIDLYKHLDNISIPVSISISDN